MKFTETDTIFPLGLNNTLCQTGITVDTRYFEVDGTNFYKFNLLWTCKKVPAPNYGWRKQSICIFGSERRLNFAEYEITSSNYRDSTMLQKCKRILKQILIILIRDYIK